MALSNAEKMRAYRLRKREQGLCQEGGCWKPSEGRYRCVKHHEEAISRQRIRDGIPDLIPPINQQCEICGSLEKMVPDHNHLEPGVLRGWLCDRCNRGLGFFRDNPDFLYEAARYLEK